MMSTMPMMMIEIEIEAVGRLCRERNPGPKGAGVGHRRRKCSQVGEMQGRCLLKKEREKCCRYFHIRRYSKHGYIEK